jgi:hypothetical protein
LNAGMLHIQRDDLFDEILFVVVENLEIKIAQ